MWVVKAQVHAGGRGKAGGVKLVDSPEAAGKAAAAMLGTRLKTHQTGPEGLPVDQVFVEEGSKIARELYLSLVLNRDKGHIAFIASAAGGMDIEEVAAHTPEKIIRVNVHRAGPAALPVPRARLRPRPRRQAGRAVRRASRWRCTSCIYEKDAPGRAQPADRHRRRQPRGARRQDQHRRQRAVPPEGPGRDARHPPGRRDRACWPASTTSTTSRWTATSAAWSTAPASPWRRWT